MWRAAVQKRRRPCGPGTAGRGNAPLELRQGLGLLHAHDIVPEALLGEVHVRHGPRGGGLRAGLHEGRVVCGTCGRAASGRCATQQSAAIGVGPPAAMHPSGLMLRWDGGGGAGASTGHVGDPAPPPPLSATAAGERTARPPDSARPEPARPPSPKVFWSRPATPVLGPALLQCTCGRGWGGCHEG